MDYKMDPNMTPQNITNVDNNIDSMLMRDP